MISQSLSASKSEISRSSEDLGIFYVPKNLVKFTRNLQTWRDLTLEIFYQNSPFVLNIVNIWAYL